MTSPSTQALASIKQMCTKLEARVEEISSSIRAEAHGVHIRQVQKQLDDAVPKESSER
jgi:hypothetical protein